MKFDIQPLGGAIGAVVRGWQPGQELTEDERATIKAALGRYLVLVFRGQRQPTDGELIAFAESFGDLLRGSAFLERTRDNPEILRVGNLVGDDGKPQGTGGASMMDWHSDYSYVDRVGDITFLNAVQLPKKPPHTYFCDQYRAAETLPEDLRQRVCGLRALHSVSHYYEDGGSQDVERFRADRERDKAQGIEAPSIPEAEYPVIVRHPETGREILYVSPAITCSIIGLDNEEGGRLLDELHAHSTRPDNVYTHDWEPDDLVMFDTLGTMHKRDSWDQGEQRYMRQLSTVRMIT